MAGSLNKVQLIGRLGADPEVKQVVKKCYETEYCHKSIMER